MTTNNRWRQARRWASAATLLALTAAAQAALIDQGDGTVKDTNTNLVWLKDWNDSGLATWRSQMAWAADLDFAGSSAWRLPAIGEYTALFGSYGDLTLLAVLEDVQTVNGYWSATPDPREKGTAAHFNAQNGAAPFGNDLAERYAVAVRLADAPAPVPEPQTLALVLLALGATAMVRRRPG